MKINVGDFVKISDPCCTYTLFHNFFNFCDVDLNIISRYAYRQCPKENTICQVKATFQHPRLRNKRLQLYVVQDIHNGKVYIMDAMGVVKRFKKYVVAQNFI